MGRPLSEQRKRAGHLIMGGMTHEQAAKEVDVHASTVRRWYPPYASPSGAAQPTQPPAPAPLPPVPIDALQLELAARAAPAPVVDQLVDPPPPEVTMEGRPLSELTAVSRETVSVPLHPSREPQLVKYQVDARVADRESGWRWARMPLDLALPAPPTEDDLAHHGLGEGEYRVRAMPDGRTPSDATARILRLTGLGTVPVQLAAPAPGVTQPTTQITAAHQPAPALPSEVTTLLAELTRTVTELRRDVDRQAREVAAPAAAAAAAPAEPVQVTLKKLENAHAIELERIKAEAQVKIAEVGAAAKRDEAFASKIAEVSRPPETELMKLAVERLLNPPKTQDDRTSKVVDLQIAGFMEQMQERAEERAQRRRLADKPNEFHPVEVAAAEALSNTSAALAAKMGANNPAALFRMAAEKAKKDPEIRMQLLQMLNGDQELQDLLAADMDRIQKAAGVGAGDGGKPDGEGGDGEGGKEGRRLRVAKK